MDDNLMIVVGILLLLAVVLLGTGTISACEDNDTGYKCTATGQGHTCPMPPYGVRPHKV